MIERKFTIIGLCCMFLLPSCQSGQTERPTHQSVTLNGQTFNLELALDSNSRYQGLSGRQSIDDDGGMLFVFPYPEVANFVMRDCFVPIDIIFLSPTGKVLVSHEMKVEPPETRSNPSKQYGSRYPTQFVIELKGGTLKTLSLKPGDNVKLPLQALKDMAE